MDLTPCEVVVEVADDIDVNSGEHIDPMDYDVAEMLLSLAVEGTENDAAANYDNLPSDDESNHSIQENLVEMETTGAVHRSLPEDENQLKTNTKNDIKKRKKMNYKRKMNQQLREKGEEYTGLKYDKESHTCTTIPKAARVMSPPCTSNFCAKATTRHCTQCTEQERKNLFTQFWAKNKQEKAYYVRSHVDILEPKKVDIFASTPRPRTLQYFLRIAGCRKRVCMKMFLSTLGLKEKEMRSMLQEENPKKARTSGKVEKSRDAARSFIRAKEFAGDLLDKLPKLPSHFARAQSDKLYLQHEFNSIRDVHSFATKRALARGIKKPVSWAVFLELFREKKLAVHALKKDCCDVCEMYRLKHISEEEFYQHRLKVAESRSEKTKDKKNRSPHVLHIIADVQKILLLPSIKNNLQYYKTKLQIRNFTLYNHHTRRTRCKLWVETEGGCGANVFASMMYSFIEEMLLEDPLITEIIIWVDNCSAQNKNTLLSNVLLHLAIKHNIVIIQKYFLRGHSQSEVDTTHASIERFIKNKRLFTPKMYVEAIVQARSHASKDGDHPGSYEVDLLDHTSFKDFSGVKYYKHIRPGNSTGDPTVSDIRALKYSPDGVIQFKVGDFSSPWTNMPHRVSQPTCIIKDRLYDARIPIKTSKFNDLQSLKNFIPEQYHCFYDELPHQ